MKSTLVAEKTARVQRVFGASDYGSRVYKDEQFLGNSSIFKWKNRKIMIQVEESQILWTLKALHVVLKFHMGVLIPFISKLKKLLKKESMVYMLVSMAYSCSLLCDCSKAKTARIILCSATKPLPH